MVRVRVRTRVRVRVRVRVKVCVVPVPATSGLLAGFRVAHLGPAGRVQGCPPRACWLA